MRETINLLFIEDNPDDVYYIKEIIEGFKTSHQNDLHLNIAVTVAESIHKSFDYITEKNEIHAILLDLSLPDCKGLEGLDLIKSKAIDIPIIILTGLNDHKTAIDALKLGVQDYLVKGKINEDLLVRTIRYSIERQKLTSMLRSLSFIDDLTGLYNRRGFNSIYQKKIKLASREKKSCLVYFIDLDYMKKINDNYGHKEGDFALISVAEILKNSFRDSDILARIGGDEFAAFAFRADKSHEKIIKDRICENLDEFNKKSQKDYTLSVSIGSISTDKYESLSIENLVKSADNIMYRDKTNKKELLKK